MEIKVSLDAVEFYVFTLVWKYIDQHGVSAEDPNEYVSGIRNYLATLKLHPSDIPFLHAALVDLVRNNKLTNEIVEEISGRCNYDFNGREEVHRILNLMLIHLENEVKTFSGQKVEVDFIRSKPAPSAWKEMHEKLNPGFLWHSDTPQRVEATQPCPRSGFWFTPAQVGSRRYFKQGDIMPALQSDYGMTYWQWDPNQDPPKL